MPWLRRGPEKEHVCYPPRPRPDSEWYCPRCMVIWVTEFRSPEWDFINDRPMNKVWMWVKTNGYMSYD